MAVYERFYQIGTIIFSLDKVQHATYSPGHKNTTGIYQEAETTLYFGDPSGTGNYLDFKGEDAVLVWDLCKSACGLKLKPEPVTGGPSNDRA